MTGVSSVIRPVLWVLLPGGTRELLVTAAVIAAAVLTVVPARQKSEGSR